MITFKLPGGSLHVCGNGQDLSERIAEAFISIASQAVRRTGRFRAALSGGSTPKSLFSLLAEPAFGRRVPWDKAALFWSDERCVPPDSPESNYRMAKEALLSQIDIPPENIHPLSGQESNPEQAAGSYESLIKQEFSPSGDAVPEFDLVLLGLGQDGHTASLFPGTGALKVSDRLVVANYVPKFQAYRITFTYPVLNAARHVVFMVAGEDKKDILAQALQSPDLIYPCQLVRPRNGALEWFADQSAASKLDLGKLVRA